MNTNKTTCAQFVADYPIQEMVFDVLSNSYDRKKDVDRPEVDEKGFVNPNCLQLGDEVELHLTGKIRGTIKNSKGRPGFTDNLIVEIPTEDWLSRVCEIPVENCVVSRISKKTELEFAIEELQHLADSISDKEIKMLHERGRFKNMGFYKAWHLIKKHIESS